MTLFPPTVVGIYGVSGCGKSTLLSKLTKSRPEWRCLEGSHVIQQFLGCSRSMKDFESMSETEKQDIRNQAIGWIQSQSGLTLVAGHCSFPTNNGLFNDVFTRGDAKTYKAILYMDKDPNDIVAQRDADTESSKRIRPVLSADAIAKWMDHEKELLRRECKEHGIHFAILDPDDVEAHVIEHILGPLVSLVKNDSEKALLASLEELPRKDIYLLVDGDRTLCREDTSAFFIDKAKSISNVELADDPLKQIFKRYPTYTFQAFVEVALLYSTLVDENDYQQISKSIGNVSIYSEWVSFLSNLPTNVHAVLVTSGNREIWQAALEKHGLSNTISLVAGNHASLHAYIVTDRAKALVAHELRKLSVGCRIISFGDSSVDIPMIKASDRGYIVADEKRNRSMKDFIQDEAASGNPNIFQLCLDQSPGKGVCSHNGIKVGSLLALQEEIVSGVIHRVFHYTRNPASAVLATKSRRSDVSGPALQHVHYEIGVFLADKLLQEFGRFQNNSLVQETTCPHVQGRTFTGLTTSGESIVILPLMRGGEPMSRGVYERFPSARLVHWTDGCQTNGIITAKDTVIVVDSVVNRGDSVRGVITQLQSHCGMIYVLTGVMQKEASTSLPVEFPRVRFLALRVSDNKYTGRGGTDTGNRLFGTI